MPVPADIASQKQHTRKRRKLLSKNQDNLILVRLFRQIFFGGSRTNQLMADVLRVLAGRLTDPQKSYTSHELVVLLSLTFVLQESRNADRKIVSNDRLEAR